MRAQFSRRHEHDEKTHYREVLHQEGKVWLDSDWNAQAAAATYHDEARTRDLVGHSGAPALYRAFEIIGHTGDEALFDINGGAESDGDFYVDGILCRKERRTPYYDQPDFPNPPALPMPTPGRPTQILVYLEVWQRLITELEDKSIREVALGGPDTTVRSKTIAQVRWTKLDTAKRCFTDLPSPTGHGTLTTIQATPPRNPADICRLGDEVTFTGRENRLYRVEIHEPGDVRGAGVGSYKFDETLANAAMATATSLTITNALTDGAAKALRDFGRITISDSAGRRETARVINVDADRKTLWLASPLRSSYAAGARVVGGIARFKWSSSNGAFAAGIRSIDPTLQKLTLTTLGRDNVTALRRGDLVEISDDWSELRDGRGVLRRLAADPNPDELTVTLNEPLPAHTFDVNRHALLRRWDGEGFASISFDEIATPDMDLGDGVHIRFDGHDLRTGDYWQFTTRVIDGSVEQLTDAKPHGIVRHRCPLAVVEITRTNDTAHPIDDNPSIERVGEIGDPALPPLQSYTTTRVLSDCRPKIPRLTRMWQLHYVSGDGQEVLAGESTKPLIVGVTNGPFATAGQEVEFSSSTGTLLARVNTNDDGLASFIFRSPVPGTYVVTAKLVLTDDDAILSKPLPVKFNVKVDLLASCCTIVVREEDAQQKSLQAIIDERRKAKATKICLMPGRYPLSRPLVITAKHGAMTIEGCGRGVVLAPDSRREHFLPGLIQLIGTTGVTLRNLEIEPASVPLPENERGVPGPIDVRVGLRIADAIDCTIEECTFRVDRPPAEGFGACILAGGELRGFAVRRNAFFAAQKNIAGIVTTPAVVELPDRTRKHLPCVLARDRVEANRFEGLSVAVLACGELHEMAVRDNSIGKCHHGVVVLSSHWFARLARVSADQLQAEVLDPLRQEAEKLTSSLNMARAALAISTYAAFHPTIVAPLTAFATLPLSKPATMKDLDPGVNESAALLVNVIATHAAHEDEMTALEVRVAEVADALTNEWRNPPLVPADVELIRGSALNMYFAAKAVESTLDISHNTISRNRLKGTSLLVLLDDGGRYTGLGVEVDDPKPAPDPTDVRREAVDVFPKPVFTPKAVQNRTTVSSNDLRTRDPFFPAALVIFARRCTVTGNVIGNEYELSDTPLPAPQPIKSAEDNVLITITEKLVPSLVVVGVPDRYVYLWYTEGVNAAPSLPPKETDTQRWSDRNFPQPHPLLAVAVTGNSFTGWPVLPRHTARYLNPVRWWDVNSIE